MLRASLPDKEEHVILVKMSPIQRRLYSAFIDTLKEEHLEGWANSNPLKAFAVCCKVRTFITVEIVAMHFSYSNGREMDLKLFCASVYVKRI